MRFVAAGAVALVLTACTPGAATPGPSQSAAGSALSPVPSGAAVDLEAAVRQIEEVPDRAEAPPGLESSVFQNADTMDEFLTNVLQATSEYWSLTFAANDLPPPQVGYLWTQPGQSVTTACVSGGVAQATDDTTAAYCSADDTIYVSQQFAFNLWNGLVENREADFLPGDFGVAYVVAHEFAHNIQAELLIEPVGETVKNHELMADCFAGTWANWAYEQGQLDPGDVEEAIASANLLGDFDFRDPQHHGTPDERSQAWTLGYETGQPARCAVYDTPTRASASPAATGPTPEGAPPATLPPPPPPPDVPPSVEPSGSLDGRRGPLTGSAEQVEASRS